MSSIRACSTGGCHPSPIPARCGSQGGLGTVARVVGDAQEIYDQRIPVDDALAADRGPLQALSPGAAPAVHPRASRFRRGGPDRLSFDAVDRRRTRRAAARRRRARRPLRHELRAGVVAEIIEERCAGSATPSAATSPMPAASSPSITAIRPPGCMRSRSSSIARSTWTSAATSGSAVFRQARDRPRNAGRPARRRPARGAAAVSRGGGIIRRAKQMRKPPEKKGRSRLLAAQV